MAVNLDYARAHQILLDAFNLATSDRPLPQIWLDRTTQVGQSPCKTYIAVFGTILLAKATDARVDVFALKATTPSEGAYGPRMLAEGVLVPFALDHRVHLGTRGLQPWNNQPWFRYDVIDKSMRIAPKCRSAFAYLFMCFNQVDQLSQHDAFEALAAFLRQRLVVESEYEALQLGSQSLPLPRLVAEADAFVRRGVEGGKRGQALVVAAFDLVFSDVVSGAINDPSRHWPGDIQVFGDDPETPVALCEVRQRYNDHTDVRLFCRKVHEAGVGRAVIAALNNVEGDLDSTSLVAEANERFHVNLTILFGVDEVLRAAVAWSNLPLDAATTEFAKRFGERLHEIEVLPQTLQDWQATITSLTNPSH
jgi:hypothetical protein